MTKTDDNSTFYEVNATIPPELVAPLLHMLQKSGGHLVRVTSTRDRPVVRRSGKQPAREVVVAALREAGAETYRGELRRALELNGHSPASVGPICTMLQKDGRIFSPRRGFWQMRV
jgi:hypothetical protein